MQSYSNASNSAHLNRQRLQLEQLWQVPERPVAKRLKQLGNWLLAVFAPTGDLTIQQTETGWIVRENGQMYRFSSEEAVRIWLEQRYYAH
ncbi:MAG: hypothetical protein AAFQ61_13570 [Cyanobacteria bacterium J06626_23]